MESHVGKGHVGASWWEVRRGVWRVAACALGGEPHSATVTTDDELVVIEEVKELLNEAVQELTHVS